MFVSLLVLMYGLEKIYDFGLLHNQNIKLTNVQVSPKNAEILVHGPCEPLWMVSPELLDSITGVHSYNLALSHSDFADNYLHLYYYLRTNRPPSMLLLYVTPESLDRRYNTFNSYRFAPYLQDTLVAEVVRECDPDYYRWHFIPFMKYAYYNNRVTFEMLQGWKHFLTGRRNAYYESGFEPPAKRVWGNHQGDFIELYKKNVEFSIDSIRVKYLVKTIRLARKNGIKVYLYESPVLREALAFQPNRARMLGYIESVALAEGVPFVKFENLEMAKHRKYFISALNCNMEGVRLFNDTLGKLIRSFHSKQSSRDSIPK